VPRVQSYASVQNFARQESAKAAMNHMRWNLASQYKHSASCARSGPFGCGGKDFSSSYGHVHDGKAVVFM